MNAKDLNPLASGITLSIIGEPKSGKSHMARSARKVGSVFAFLAPEEVMSYAGLDVEYEVVVDDEWHPSGGAFKATAYPKLNAALTALEQRADIPKTVIFDTGNATFGDAMWNWVMGSYGSDDPRKMSNPYDAYVMYASRFREMLTRLLLLRHRRACHIIVTWHQDIRELEGLGAPRKEQVKEGGKERTVTKWDVARMPMIRGQVRNEVIRAFDFSFYVEPVIGARPPRSRLVVVPPDATRTLAGSRFQPVQAALAAMDEVPNEFPALLELVQKHYKSAP